MNKRYLQWAAYLPLDIAFKIASYVLAPIVALFCKSDGWLPRWLSWFQTPDNPLDGDANWVLNCWQWRFLLPLPLATYVGRVGWQWRNPGYGFGFDALGAPVSNPVRMRGDPFVTDQPMHYGTLWRSTADGYFQFYHIRPLSWTARALRVNLGWKLWGAPVDGEIRQYIFSVRFVK